jgi:PAS domain S-box-containing protein
MTMSSDKDIVRTITWLAGIIVFVMVIVIPVGYFSFSQQYMAGSLESEAAMNAQLISQIISADPDMWQFEQVRLEEFLSRRPREGLGEIRRVLAMNGTVIAENADPLQHPLIARRVSLFDAGHRVGSLEIARSLRPLLLRTCLLMLVMAPLGAGVFRVLRVLPVRALRKSEAALREERDRLHTYLDVAQVMLVALDLEQRVTLINRKGCEVLGAAEQDILSRNWFDHFVPDSSRAASKATFSRMINGDGAPGGYFENPVRTASGGERIIAWHVIVVRDGAGAIVGTLRSGEDITERKHLEAQLLHAQKMESVGQLAGGVAHDFNNILSAIIGHADLLLMKMQPDDPLRGDVDQVLSSSERAARLVQSLLAFSRKQIINPQVIDINEVIQNVGKLLRRLIGSDIELRTRLAKGTVCVMADAGQLEQVLMNLATNARDAMPDGGVLTIETGRATELGSGPVAAGSAEKPGDYALISLSDTGTGMDAKTKEKIFDPFFTTKEVGKGTGLGLSTVYGIIKQHHGDVTVYSEPGLGTTFKIYLPLLSEPVSASPGAEPVFSAGGDETVLLAEDDADVRKVTCTMLERSGYTVIEAADGEEALNKFREYQDRIHLVILDVIMPRMNGKAVYDELQKIRPGVRTLFTSGHTGDVIQKKGVIEEGMDFLSKPASRIDLLHKVREVLDR